MRLGEVFTLLAYVTGGAVFLWAARQRKLATDGIGYVALVGFIAAIVGAKFTQAVFSGAPQMTFNVAAGGRSLLGGLLFGWLGVELAKRRMGIRASTGDLFALALPAGEAVGRLGCFFNQCCYGTECSVPWSTWQHGAWRHPAQLYSAAVSLFVFVGLLLFRRHAKVEGELFRWYLFAFGVTRFGLEFVRWRESLLWGLSLMQWLCIELVVYSVLWIVLKRNRLSRLNDVKQDV